MAIRLGNHTIQCETRPRVRASAGVAGKREAAGPLGRRFDRIFDDTTLNENSWEKAESGLLLSAAEIALEKAKLQPSAIQAVFAEFAGAGATVPLTGFGFNLAKTTAEAVREHGLCGVLEGPLSAASAGIMTAILSALAASVFARSKDK